jgi:hypothetical protein
MIGAKLAKKKRKPESSLQIGDGYTHKPKQPRFHIAQEYDDKNQGDMAEEQTRSLLPWAQRSARGKGRARNAVHA